MYCIEMLFIIALRHLLEVIKVLNQEFYVCHPVCTIEMHTTKSLSKHPRLIEHSTLNPLFEQGQFNETAGTVSLHMF